MNRGGINTLDDKTIAFIARWLAIAVLIFEAVVLLGCISGHAEADAPWVMCSDVAKSATTQEKVTLADAPQIIYSPLIGEDAAPVAIADEPADYPYISELPLSAELQAYLYETWTAAGFDYATALGIIDVETGGTFNPNAINKNSHDYGLFQINRRSWLKTCKKLFGVSSMDEMLDPYLNISMGLYVYADCVERYGQTEKALVAYNTGYGRSGSTKYSRKVLREAEKWRAYL